MTANMTRLQREFLHPKLINMIKFRMAEAKNVSKTGCHRTSTASQIISVCLFNQIQARNEEW